MEATNQKRYHFSMSRDGEIRVKNPSAYWLPELTLQKEIGGTLYTVSGSYEGAGLIDKKLERVMNQNLENMEKRE